MGKATLYLQDDVHHALRLKAAETHESMSQLVNDALRVALTEDLEDISDWHQRRNEKSVGYDEFLEQVLSPGRECPARGGTSPRLRAARGRRR